MSRFFLQSVCSVLTVYSSETDILVMLIYSLNHDDGKPITNAKPV